MNALDRIIGSAEYRAASSGLANPADWLVEALGSTATFSGQKVTLDKALTLSAFRAAVMLLSETVGLLPLKVYRDVDGDKFEARNHRTWRMLHDRPNPSTSAHRFWSTATVHLAIHGNIFIEKLRGTSGLVEELWLRDPRAMHVEWDDGVKQKVFYEENSNGTKKVWNDERMLHIPGWSTNGLTGESILYRGRQTIGNAIAREEFEGSFYKRGAVLAAVIQHPGRLGDTGAKRLRDYFAKWYGGSGRAHGTPVLEEGAELKTVGSNLVDLEFEAAQTRTRTEVAVMFNIPPSFLGGSTGDSLTYATVEANMVQLMQHAISPLTSTIQSALSADPSLFPFPTWFTEFTLDGMLRGDSASRSAFYKVMHDIGALTTNEIRAMENKPPLDEPAPPEPAPLEDVVPLDVPTEDVPGAPIIATGGSNGNG